MLVNFPYLQQVSSEMSNIKTKINIHQQKESDREGETGADCVTKNQKLPK